MSRTHIVIDGVCQECGVPSNHPDFEGGPFVNPETRQEYWPGEPGDPYLARNLDEETDDSEPD